MNSHRKGKRGEREVVTLWRQHGWPKAARSPGSGALRPYGAGDLSPWPGDLIGTEPWIVEVKYDERVYARSRGWWGSGFLRQVLEDLGKLADRHASVIGRREPPVPVLFARSNHRPWRVFVPEPVFRRAYGLGPAGDGGWVEVFVTQFFEEVARGDHASR